MEHPTYDYIIAGAGCAGLSLLYHMLLNPELQQKKILVIDRAIAVQSNKTWCYWEDAEGPFDKIVSKKWNRLLFRSNTIEKTFDLRRYTYKMIKSEDFYALVLDFASKFSSVSFREARIKSFEATPSQVKVSTERGEHTGRYLFNSTGIEAPVFNKQNTLLQHFLGWKVRTEKPVFNPSIATFMDFDVTQKKGATFFYLLPTDSHTALVEYTLFSENKLIHHEYESALKAYMRETLGLEQYQVEATESGVIPMSLQKFKRFTGERILHIGITGGRSKASTGYTFYFVQDHCRQIVTALEKGLSPTISPSFKDRLYQWYDRTLLDVLLHKRLDPRTIFSALFRSNAPEGVLAFLNNNSTFREEWSIVQSVPARPFIWAGFRQMLRWVPVPARSLFRN